MMKWKYASNLGIAICQQFSKHVIFAYFEMKYEFLYLKQSKCSKRWYRSICNSCTRFFRQLVWPTEILKVCFLLQCITLLQIIFKWNYGQLNYNTHAMIWQYSATEWCTQRKIDRLLGQGSFKRYTARV